MTNKYQNLSSFTLPNNFRGKSLFTVQLWWIIQSSFFALSPQFMYSWRRYLLRLFGARIGKNVYIRPSVRITYPWNVVIGDNTWVGDDVVLYSLGNIFLGDNVVVSQKCYLCSAAHNYKSPNFDIYTKNINIESEVWLCTDVFVGPGVRISHATVVGARSSVFKSLPAKKVFFGNPLKFQKNR